MNACNLIFQLTYFVSPWLLQGLLTLVCRAQVVIMVLLVGLGKCKFQIHCAYIRLVMVDTYFNRYYASDMV